MGVISTPTPVSQPAQVTLTPAQMAWKPTYIPAKVYSAYGAQFTEPLNALYFATLDTALFVAMLLGGRVVSLPSPDAGGPYYSVPSQQYFIRFIDAAGAPYDSNAGQLADFLNRNGLPLGLALLQQQLTAQGIVVPTVNFPAPPAPVQIPSSGLGAL